MTVLKFAFYCTCGDAMTGEISPADGVVDMEASFDQIHHGEGHERTDRETARRARRRKDRRRTTA